MTTPVEQLKEAISLKTRKVLSDNILFHKLQSRAPLPHELSQYVLNCHYLITFTQPNLRAALTAAIEINNYKLAHYFLDKVFEEIGHEKWAEDDLKSNRSDAVIGQHKATPSMIKLTKYLTNISYNSPMQYAAYVLVAEYTIAHFGKEILELFKATPKNENKITVISKHVDLDVAHSHDDEEKLKEILNSVSSTEITQLLETVHIALDLLDQSIAEIYDNNQFVEQSSVNATL